MREQNQWEALCKFIAISRLKIYRRIKCEIYMKDWCTIRKQAWLEAKGPSFGVELDGLALISSPPFPPVIACLVLSYLFVILDTSPLVMLLHHSSSSSLSSSRCPYKAPFLSLLRSPSLSRRWCGGWWATDGLTTMRWAATVIGHHCRCHYWYAPPPAALSLSLSLSRFKRWSGNELMALADCELEIMK